MFKLSHLILLWIRVKTDQFTSKVIHFDIKNLSSNCHEMDSLYFFVQTIICFKTKIDLHFMKRTYMNPLKFHRNVINLKSVSDKRKYYL